MDRMEQSRIVINHLTRIMDHREQFFCRLLLATSASDEKESVLARVLFNLSLHKVMIEKS
jgi:hypothetical protein